MAGPQVSVDRRPRRVRVRRWFAAWATGILIVWIANVYGSANVLLWARKTPDTCEGLDALRNLHRTLPLGDRVLFVAETADEESGRRFFCSQYELAPRVVRWVWPASLPLAAEPNTSVLVFNGSPTVRLGLQRRVQASADEQGYPLQEYSAADITVVRVGER